MKESDITEFGLCQADGAVCGARYEADKEIHINYVNLRECGGSGCAMRTWLPVGSLLPWQYCCHLEHAQGCR